MIRLPTKRMRGQRQRCCTRGDDGGCFIEFVWSHGPHRQTATRAIHSSTCPHFQLGRAFLQHRSRVLPIPMKYAPIARASHSPTGTIGAAPTSPKMLRSSALDVAPSQASYLYDLGPWAAAAHLAMGFLESVPYPYISVTSSALIVYLIAGAIYRL